MYIMAPMRHAHVIVQTEVTGVIYHSICPISFVYDTQSHWVLYVLRNYGSSPQPTYHAACGLDLRPMTTLPMAAAPHPQCR